jgi:hypothetical protein
MAYDLVRQRVVLFGGRISTGFFSDTWEWDGSNWSQRTPAANPGGRHGHAMAYDVVRQRVVLFGGLDNQTWEWDGGNWARRTPAASPPSRSFTAMAYDLGRQRVVLFGGFGPAPLSDTWEWDGSNWLLRSPAVSPPGRHGHAMAYDAFRRRVVLFGGRAGTTNLSDSWEWDGSNWMPLTPTASPSAQEGHAMAYDAARQRVVFHGNATWLLGPLVRATAQPLGIGCLGTNGIPVLASNEAYLGNPAFRLQLRAARASSACVVALAAAPDNLAIGGGCTLYLKLPLVPWGGVTDAAGFIESPLLSVPMDAALRGVALYAQAFVADPQGPVLGLAFSAGRRLVIGD